MSQWFFLSYAHDNLENYVRRFHRDLNKEILSLTSRDEGEEGFFDERSLELGSNWPDKLTSALHGCRAFVPLYSPAYFMRDYCGKEWQVFKTRQDDFNRRLAPASPSSLIFPVLWLPESGLPKPLPPSILDIQYDDGDFPERYAEVGLRQLMALKKNNDHYREFVATLAGKIVRTARANQLPADSNPRPIAEIENPFRQSLKVNGARTQTANAGPRYVHFIFVAGRRDELCGLRQGLDPYGENGGRDWQPYLPDVADDVGIIAQKITADERLHYIPLDIDDTIMSRIEDAERQNNIVAIVVDTWTLCLPRYRTTMREYDGRNFLNCVVLVSWNNRDEETEARRSALINEMQSTFLRKCIQRDPNCFVEITSLDELRSALSNALHKALQRMAEKTQVMKRAESEQVFSKPVILGVRRMSA